MNRNPEFTIRPYLVVQVGHVYRAKEPRICPNGMVNDRIIVSVNLAGGDVQFDGPAVKRKGRTAYPRCRLDAFKAWADEDITDKVTSPEGTKHWQRQLDAFVFPPTTKPMVEEQETT